MAYRPLFGSKKREALWKRESHNAYVAGEGLDPICNICGLPVTPGQAWDESHDPGRPKVFGGKDVGIAHRRCNHEHGAKVVTPAKAKADRQRRKHIGAAGPGLGRHPMQGGRRSPLSKSFNNGVVARSTLAEKIARMRAKRALNPAVAGLSHDDVAREPLEEERP